MLEGDVSRLKPREMSLNFVRRFCHVRTIDTGVVTARQPDTSSQNVEGQGGADWLHSLHRYGVITGGLESWNGRGVQ